ncbi:MAG TPA: 4-(cytidine 5'-diphospho)-2-C-methyl-D-erythritol kinase [Candidatus Izemoplasmatales bacterium]|nr:4-(cytidine 5'-diphospho)-2-C-methyl-D-erythritol kinase [Candidatus Izemoplasmatales bacterium]
MLIEKKAYAKINLFLNVLNKRRDGYHNLEMVNAKIDLYDEIHIKKCQVSTGIIIKSNDMFLSSQDNIILQCARYMQDRYNIHYGMEIKIKKKIPYGAGLGGNSSDAAEVIRGISEVAELKLPEETLNDIAQMFGADIPYCLSNEVAYVTQTGEDVKPIPNQLKGKSILLIHPKKHILTADVFKHADKKGYKVKDINPLLSAIEKNDYGSIKNSLYNSLEEIVVEMDDAMRDFKSNLIQDIGDSGLVMTGSGSTFIKLLDEVNQGILDYIDKNKDKFLINIYKII